jgi:NhaP-type Na+/H+ or K+/H+ antiporter
MLSTLFEGESLFNDASSIVLFEIFLHMLLLLCLSTGGAPEMLSTLLEWGIPVQRCVIHRPV